MRQDSSLQLTSRTYVNPMTSTAAIKQIRPDVYRALTGQNRSIAACGNVIEGTVDALYFS